MEYQGNGMVKHAISLKIQWEKDETFVCINTVRCRVSQDIFLRTFFAELVSLEFFV